MCPDCRPDVGMGVGQRSHRAEVGNLVANLDHKADARLAGAHDHALSVAIELRRMEIYVAVDQHSKSCLGDCAETAKRREQRVRPVQIDRLHHAWNGDEILPGFRP